LMESYLMSHRADTRYILCRFLERGVPVEVWFAAAGQSYRSDGFLGTT
jgi:hypothetical protein